MDKNVALETIKIIEEFNSSIKKNIAMASDEFFVIAGLDVPSKKYYGDFLQIEDGVGSIRLLKDSFKKNLKKLVKKVKNPSKITVATASTAYKIFMEFKKEIDIKNLEFEVLEVKNKFFGDDINVAGLIVGKDIIEAIKNKNIQHLLIPAVMLKKDGEGYEEVFLDGVRVEDIKKENPSIQIHVLSDYYSFDEIREIINSL